jgi:hypothetical protein
MNRRSSALLLVALSVTSHAAFAQRVLLDDSLSPQQNFALNLDWGPADVSRALTAMLANQDAPLPPLRGFLGGVNVRLDTRDYVGERVRIFMSVPGAIPGDNSSGTLELEWQARGAFESGSLRPGQEALIFEGILESPVLDGTFDFVISMTSVGAADSFNFELTYELEVFN